MTDSPARLLSLRLPCRGLSAGWSVSSKTMPNKGYRWPLYHNSRQGFATATTDRVIAGTRALDVKRTKINNLGRMPLKEH